MPTFRVARLEDLAAVEELVNAAYRTHGGWTTEADLLGGQRTDPDMLRAIVGAGDEREVLLLCVGDDAGEGVGAGELLGSVHLARDAPAREVHLGMLSVRVHRQNAGVGKLLMARAETWARERWPETRFATMFVIRQRAELIAFYERRGFRATGKREAFPYGDVRFGMPKRDDLEFIEMRKSLIDESGP